LKSLRFGGAGNILGLDSAPAYFDILTYGHSLQQGVNFASGAAGILDESGYNYVLSLSLSLSLR
jgi:hypothetical protein